MPHRGMEAPAEARQEEEADGRRNRHKPLRIDTIRAARLLPALDHPAF
ncbi:hypothetical protein JW319_22575 [Enterobacter cloacae subsp. cloacae]|nr:hypothetical protein [Enterobacter cloacae]MBW4204141.1 hypothetical protein [Enterobacter cloacae subsp. cloacae]